MTTAPKLNLGELGASIVGCFPTLDPFEQRLSLALYRLLADGQPARRATLAERLETSVETVNRIVDGWPGVFSDSQRQIVGYWGLSIPSVCGSPHKVILNRRNLSAWCAWDTLFLPQLLGGTAEIESSSPAGGIVRLVVSPEQLERVEPSDAQMSFLVPDCAGVQKDVVATFCHFIHFFPSRQAGEGWAAKHPGTFLLPVHEAHVVARLKNEAQYRQALQ
jgi:alkylmercury lyase